jgi:hypothetical protein
MGKTVIEACGCLDICWLFVLEKFGNIPFGKMIKNCQKIY